MNALLLLMLTLIMLWKHCLWVCSTVFFLNFFSICHTMNTLKEIVWEAANALFRLTLFTRKPQLPSLNPAYINYYCVVFPLVIFYFPHFLHLRNGILWKSSFSCIYFLNISIRMDLGMFIYPMGYNVILPLFIHLLAQVVLTLTTGNSFRLVPFFSTYASFFENDLLTL